MPYLTTPDQIAAAHQGMFGQLPPPAQAGMFGAAPPAQQPGIYGSVLPAAGNFLTGNANGLLGFGLGMLSGQTPQQGFANGLQGYMAGAQMDMTSADRKKAKEDELKRLKALHDAMQSGALGQMTPQQQALLESNPDLATAVAQNSFIPKSKEWQRLSDTSLFNPQTGETRAAAGASSNYYGGQSVDAQAYNHLLQQGYTKEQIDQLAGGKIITDPSTGALKFATPQDLIGPGGQRRPGQGGAQASPPPGQQGVAPQAQPGMRQLTEGKPNKAKSQDQVKGEVLIANAEGDFQTANQLFDALGSKYDQAAGALPGGRGLQSGQYQVGSDAVKNVVQSYIYAVSGAQAPEAEVQRMMSLVQPSIFDKPEAVAAKKQRLAAMMEAIRTKAREGAAPQQPQSAGPSGTTSNGLNWSVSP